MKNLLLCFSLVLFFNCSNDNDNTPFAPTAIEFTEIDRGQLDGYGIEGITASNMVVTNSSDWQNLMNQMNIFNNHTDDFTETDIDFEEYIIIAIFLEVKISFWAVTITDIIEKEDSVIVTSIEDNSSGSSVITQPFHIVKIPITEKPIEFESSLMIEN